jgi:putative transposase
MILTYKYRIKDADVAKHLERHARSVNYVWNYCCEIQRESEKRWKAGCISKWPSAFDLIKLCTGVASDLGLHSDTVQTVCRQFADSRNARKRCPRFRAGRGPKRSLGWIPFIPRAVKIDKDQVVYFKRSFRLWKSRELEGVFKAGSFIEDSRGRWYAAFQCEVEEALPTGSGAVGIDLGLKTVAALSDGGKIPNLRHYRKYEGALRTVQRAGNKRRLKAIHAKIANARRHHLHQQSSKIARNNELIVVGNVNPSSLVKTRMAKSVLDAGWSAFRNMLEYKARRHRARYLETDERFTSQTCSSCQTRSGPKGIAGLGIREWECSNCGASHDRDLNAAMNILALGLERQPLAEEIPGL